MIPLILASTSVYRRELLARLGLVFTQKPPLFDEESFKAKFTDPCLLTQFLAKEKAASLAQSDTCVIGGDQVVSVQGQIIGKAGNLEKACQQLEKMQGKTHELVTAICVIHQGVAHQLLDVTVMKMRQLSRQQIENYVQLDQAIDCAGSYKIEKHGIALFEAIESKDFTAIQGIPLLELSKLLIKLGYKIPAY